MNRKYVYAFNVWGGNCCVVNYFDKDRINEFFQCFDVYGSFGKHVFHNNDRNTFMETWFECSKEFFEMLHTETMKQAFKRMGVDLVFEYPFKEE